MAIHIPAITMRKTIMKKRVPVGRGSSSSEGSSFGGFSSKIVTSSDVRERGRPDDPVSPGRPQGRSEGERH